MIYLESLIFDYNLLAPLKYYRRCFELEEIENDL